MRIFRHLAVATLLVLTGCASEEKAADHSASPTGQQAAAVAHSQHEVTNAGFKGTFHIDAPAQAAYTCPMHPEVVSDKAGICPQCKMDLAKQTHQIALEVADAKGQPVRDAAVRLTIKDAHNMMQGLDLKGDTYQGAFHLAPGAQQITAFVKPRDAAQAVELSLPYEVK